MPGYAPLFAPGDEVRIAEASKLREFQRTWKYHDPLSNSQVAHGGERALVAQVGVYHGGDILYWLEGLPGTWHESCLGAV